ncbi:hypothetical protein BDF22DRAFT_742818 [Syncephalis plumigaleata]|nr:hypothetical protein BDF22DRAFT_742818 [Syncephalis plumigaleata]
MPVIDYNNPDDIKQIKALEKKYDISFDEMDKLTISDFYMKASGDIPEQRNRLLGIQLELFAFLLIFCLFSRNIIKLSRALMSNPCALPLWCSFISSFSGMITEGAPGATQEELGIIRGDPIDHTVTTSHAHTNSKMVTELFP